MKKIFTLCVVLCLSYLSMGATNPKHEFRATWLTTAWGNDWPKTKVTNATTRKQQQDSLIAIFDRLQAGNMNAVCLQVRGRSDAFYQSSYEPWAAELAGARGTDPGYDPLAFAIEEAHKRGLELHAWVNPFRVTSAGTLDANDLVKKNAGQWIIQYNNGSFTGEIIDPGYPEAREYVLNVLMEIINNYDIDGIVMDDYFYPYGGTTTEDAASKALHKPANVVDVNQDGYTDDDWRRSNVDVFLKEFYNRIQTTKPWVRLGMGTFGIWTTQTKVAQAYGISLPSGISGLDDYDEQACNPVEWVKNGYVDYINPQLYWPTTSTGQNYNKLCQWWAKDVCEHFSNQLTNGKKVHFFSSQSISSHSAVSEIQAEIDANRNNLSSGSTGSVFFDTDAYLTMDKDLMTSRFATNALTPPMDWKSNTALAAPTNLTVSGSMLTWQHATAERFTVYVYPKGTAWSTAKNDPAYLQGVIYGNSLDISGIDTNMNDIAVCAYDRFGVEHTAAVYSNDSGAGTTPNPETIIWELNGGEVNTITIEVPTQSDLMLQFMNDYVAYFSTPTIDVDAFHPTGNMTGFLYRGKNTREKSVNEMILDETAGWKWLADYIVSTSASNPTIVAALNSGTEVNWRYSIAAFFEQNGSGTYNVDFSTAGQPAAWGTAYQIAHGAVLLPTYVTSAFTLPIPTHPEGHDFLGWYDNAEFIGSPLTTISADWTGSLYAKWHIIDLTWQITYTSTNGNIVTPNATDVFGANIVSYTYQDGQGVITFDGPVTSIGEKAFYQCKSLASITIPNSVTSIGESAFSECTSLSSVTIPNSVTSIRDWAFSYCSSLRSITIPNSVTSIGNSAFLCCSSLNAIYITDIAAWCNISFGNNEANPLYDAHNLYLNGKLVTDLVIPNSVTSIRDWAFSYCSSLRSITIPNSVTSIGEHAFYECFSLTSITIPNSVTSIGSSAFSYCSSLTSITIPNSVTSIGNGAFEYCSSLTSITIPNSVTSIEYYAFRGCSSLTSITIPNSVTNIGSSAFSDCSSLTSVTIPNSVTSIGDGAFYDCSSLTSVTIPNSVTSIGDCAFYDCSSLTSITIPGSVTNIGEGAFAWCTKLGSVYVKCLTPPTIAANAFYKTSPICYIPCGTLSAYKTSNWSSQLSKFIEECEENTITYTTSDGNIVTPYASDVFGVNIVSNTYSNGQGVITFDGPVTSIGLDAFYNCSVLTSITIPNSVTSIGERAFSYCSSLTSITIPNSVTNIGSSAFSDCSSLTSIAIPNSVTSIGDRAFYNCSSLTSIAIPNSVTSIGDRAFYNCSSLTSIAIPNSVTSIGDYAFRGCSSLTSIAIPNSVTSIGISAFGYCSSITSMTVENGNTVYDSREKCNAIIETATNTLIVGCQNTTIPNNVTSIGDYAFRGCSSLTSVTIPSSVTSIGDRAFYNCSSLTSVTIGENVTSIGDLAFYDTGIYNDESNWENKVLYIDDCLIDARASISGAYTINENARLIANRAFGDCSSLTSITIPNSVTSIGSSAFYKCSSLTSITIPGSVTNIGEGAFAWCTKLGFVYVKCLTPPTIAADAFYNTSPICCIPCGTLSTYKTSNWSSQLSKFIEDCEENTITYTSSNGNIVTPYASDVFGANIVSNTYSNGQGVITFDGPVTSIGDRAFHNCSSLTSITIPNSVTSIGQDAFYSYVGSSLTSITIPNSVTSIGEGAFNDCYSLTSITIPNSVKRIERITFSGCSRLTSIVIPNSVTSIGDQAFYECSRLTSIVIPNSVTSIGWLAFSGCSSLSDITLTAHSIEEFYRGKVNFLLTDGVSNAARHLQINDIEITELTISESVTSVGDYAFYNCSSLTSITIPNSVTSIGSHAFYGCSSLTSATIPESVSSIGEGATFQKCTELKHVYWNATNCTIEQNSNGNYYPPFSSLNNLEEFKFGDNVTNIPIYLCYKLAGLKAIVIPNSVTSIGTGAFSGCSSLTSVTIPNSVTSIGKYAFQDCSSLTSVTIPNSVTSIGTYVFQNCSSLISANIGNNVTNVRDYTFSGCSSLTSVTIPNSVTSIGKYAFQDCSSLTSVTIPNSVTSVESSAFNDCKALNKITLPASIRSIGPNAFAGCTKLYDIYCFAMEPPTAYESSFANYNAFLHVPCDNQRVYLLDILFGNFKYVECIEAETTPTDTVVVTPSFNDAEFIWPSNSSADSYTLAISKDGEVFCTLTFNANGQLTGIAFAPSRNGQHNAPAAAQTANGFAFTVTGLDEGANYTYDLLIQDRSGNTLQSYSGEFRTQSTNDRTVTVEYDAAQGQVTGAGTYLVGDTVTLTAIPNYGYHFVQWSDGNTDNPRTLVLTQDTILTAEFALTISGQCGDNLYWAYDEASKTIAITGSGDMYDYTKDTQPWLLFQDQITEVTTSNTTTSIGDWAFDDCSGLTSVTIGNSVTSIGEQAFNGCSSLTSITIPNSVTSIGEGAFEYCSSLDTIHVEATTPPALEDSTVFMNTPSPVCVIPCGTLATYQSSDWANQVGSFVEDCPPASAAITYVLNGGVVSAELPTYLTSSYTLPTPTREGYIFRGWYDNPQGIGDCLSTLPAGYEGTIYAYWTKEPTDALNPFAYALSSELSQDNSQLLINYSLNARAMDVQIVIMDGETAVKTIACDGLSKGSHSIAIPTAGLPEHKQLTWKVEVKGAEVTEPTEYAVNYSFYHPSAVDIDNNPENPTFGMILTNEGMHKVKDINGYLSTGYGAGIYAFNPAFEPMPNGSNPGYNGGIEFTNGRADDTTRIAYSPRRIRISEDGRIFVTSLNTDGNYLWEVNPENMNEWTSVFQGTLNDQRELVDAAGNFIAAPNAGFDVKGSGENLQLMMYSFNLRGITSVAMDGLRCDEYNLGTATTWTTAPSKSLVDCKYITTYIGTQVEYDNEGGIWIASYRGTATNDSPGLVHINAEGVEDCKLLWSNLCRAGIRFNNDFTELVVAGNNGSANKATIYAVSKDANGAPVLTEEWVIDATYILGRSLNDFAFDYAGNLYACGHSTDNGEKIVAWAMPRSADEVITTPAASKYNFTYSDAITYELNGGITNDHGWMSKDDMYHELLVDINAIIPTTRVDVDTVTLAYDKTKNIQKGIPTYWDDLSSLLIHSDFLSKWGWLINYMDSACASESKYLPSTLSVYLRYNLSAFFFEKEYTSWPQTPDYSKYGLYPYYQPAWQHAYDNPTNPTEEFILNAPYREGYTFAGWYTNADLSGEKITIVEAETNDTLYAKWIENSLVESTWKVLYTSTNGGIVAPNAIDVFGANIVSNTYENGVGTITFDGPVTSIGTAAFHDCLTLKSITIPNSVNSIGVQAFRDCSAIDSLTIPENVNSISGWAFMDCSSLLSIVVAQENMTYDSRENCNAIIETATNTLIVGCKKTIIPNGVATIGEHAFRISSLAFITIPNSVTNIERLAFCGSSIDTIYVEATTPPALADSTVFMYTPSPVCVIPCGTKEAYEASDWANYMGEFIEEGCPTVQMCGDDLYWEYADGLLTITGMGDMYDYAADTDVPWYDVRDSIKTINMPNEMTKIGNYTFYRCTALTSISLPEQLKHIGNRAFAQDTKIAGEVVIPDGVTDIADRAFYNCNKVNRFTLLPLTSPTLGEKVFESTSASFYISCEAMDDYKVATNWSKLKSRFVDACLNIYHYGTPLGANGVHTTEDTLVANIYYRRHFTPNRWETLYLPFEVDRVTVLEEGVEYDLKAWNIFGGGHYYLAKPYGIENKEVVFGFTQVVDAHTPYIIQFKDEYYRDKIITFYSEESWNKLSTSFEMLSSSFEMQMAGNTTLQDQTLEKPVYMLRATSNFILQNTTTTLHPFECYVMPYATPSGAPARMNVRFRGDVPTAVESVKGNESHLTYTVDGYTLTVYPQGQAFSIYSLNGALIYSCEAGKEAVDCELNSGCYLLHAGAEAHKIML